MIPQLVVDVWSDVVCPFCYLGQRHFRDALTRFEHATAVVVQRRAFELDPHAPLTYPGSLDEMLAVKYSLPLAHAHALNQRVAEGARQLGMERPMDAARPTNTFDAHRVIALAATQGLADVMSERLFRAYFSEGHLLSDAPTLARLADEVGVRGVATTLAGDDFVDRVRQDEREASRRGISGVPAFVMNGDVHVTGAQGADVMLDALRRAWARREEPVD